MVGEHYIMVTGGCGSGLEAQQVSRKEIRNVEDICLTIGDPNS